MYDIKQEKLDDLYFNFSDISIKTEDDLKKYLKQIDLQNNLEIDSQNEIEFEKSEEFLHLIKKIEYLQNLIEKLSNQKISALKNFNIKYAKELEQIINEKTNVLNQLQNLLHEQKQNLILDFSILQSKNIQNNLNLFNSNLEQVENFGENLKNQKIYNIKFPIIKKFFANLSKFDAIKLLTQSNFYKQNLGAKLFAQILGEFLS